MFSKIFKEASILDWIVIEITPMKDGYIVLGYKLIEDTKKNKFLITYYKNGSFFWTLYDLSLKEAVRIFEDKSNDSTMKTTCLNCKSDLIFQKVIRYEPVHWEEVEKAIEEEDDSYIQDSDTYVELSITCDCDDTLIDGALKEKLEEVYPNLNINH